MSAALKPRLRRFFSAAPPEIKLAALFLLSLAAFTFGNLWFSAALSLAAPLLFLACGFGWCVLRQNLALFALTALCLAAFSLFTASFAEAAGNGLRLFGIAACAAFTGAVTASSALLQTLERGLKFFAPLGLNARQTALALMLVLRFLPLLAETYAQLRAAQKARGRESLNLRGRAQLLGLVLVRLIPAQENIAEAIEARGFEHPAPQKEQA